MSRRLPRTLASVAAGVLAMTMTAACSSSGAKSDGASTAATSVSTGTGTGASSSPDAGGIGEAKAAVAKYTQATDFTIAPLPSAPPAGKTVAWVNCSLPTCSVGVMDAPVAALKWKLKTFEYDLTKGPQDMVRAFNQALDSKPDYIVATMVFPESIFAAQFARAKAAGIPVINNGGATVNGSTVLVQGPRVFQKAGSIAGDIALADAGKPVKIVLPVDPSIPLHVSIAKGTQDEVKRLSPDSKADLLKLSLSQPAATNVSGIVNYLKSNPDTRYIVFGGTSLYAGLHQALQAAGLADKVKIILTFPFKQDVQAVTAGEFFAVVGSEGDSHIWRAVDEAARLSVGEKITDTEPLSYFHIIDLKSASATSVDPPNYQSVYKTAWKV